MTIPPGSIQYAVDLALTHRLKHALMGCKTKQDVDDLDEDGKSAFMIAARGRPQKAMACGSASTVVVSNPGNVYNEILRSIWDHYRSLPHITVQDLQDVLLSEDKWGRNVLGYAAISKHKENLLLVISFYEEIFGDLKSMMAKRLIVDIQGASAELRPILMDKLSCDTHSEGQVRSSRRAQQSRSCRITAVEDAQEVDKFKKRKNKTTSTKAKKKSPPTTQTDGKTRDFNKSMHVAPAVLNQHKKGCKTAWKAWHLKKRIPAESSGDHKHQSNRPPPREKSLATIVNENNFPEISPLRATDRKLTLLSVPNGSLYSTHNTSSTVTSTTLVCNHFEPPKDVTPSVDSSSPLKVSASPQRIKSEELGILHTDSPTENTAAIEIPPTFYDANVLRKALNRLYKLLEEAFSGNLDALTDQVDCMRCIREVLDKSKEGPLLVSSLKYMLLQLRTSMKQHKSNTLFEEHAVNAMLAAIGSE